MLTISSSLINTHYPKAPPHHSTSLNVLTALQCNPSPPLRRKPSEKDLHAMFYSQRVSNRKRRCANPTSFDQSWRTRRPLSFQCDVPDEAQDDVDDAQTRKRSRTCASTIFERSLVRDQGDAVPEKQKARIDSLAPKVEEAPPITEENSCLLRLVKDLRSSLEEDETMQQGQAVKRTAEPEPASLKNDSTSQPPNPGRKRRYSFHSSPAAQRDLLATRADIMRIVRTRNMSRAEISLRREIYHQEQYIRAHKNGGGSVAYQQMASALSRNRHHLSVYKRRGSRWRDLPLGVRNRIAEMATQAEGEDDDVAAAPDVMDTNRVLVERMGAFARRRRHSEDAEWVNVAFGRM